MATKEKTGLIKLQIPNNVDTPIKENKDVKE